MARLSQLPKYGTLEIRVAGSLVVNLLPRTLQLAQQTDIEGQLNEIGLLQNLQSQLGCF